ncbi:MULTISPECIES: hypothetical protein [unclassified Caballeronia]|uniref:hypothetical protein n=1 Tax=unclassified Caballeronia TaxID=2646786 RepID=UPI002027AA67|nr:MULTISPECIES: hypothetical protein [unclassified Caballeronia]MDR5774829.1 hypothetical protein [Caballeronia sp. LZ002]MDR5850265.1 hypothetical protein [Caballeronia sp. LZ003]
MNHRVALSDAINSKIASKNLLSKINIKSTQNNESSTMSSLSPDKPMLEPFTAKPTANAR